MAWKDLTPRSKSMKEKKCIETEYFVTVVPKYSAHAKHYVLQSIYRTKELVC